MLRSCKSRSKLLAITVQYLRVESFLYSEIFDYLYVKEIKNSTPARQITNLPQKYLFLDPVHSRDWIRVRGRRGHRRCRPYRMSAKTSSRRVPRLRVPLPRDQGLNDPTYLLPTLRLNRRPIYHLLTLTYYLLTYHLLTYHLLTYHLLTYHLLTNPLLTTTYYLYTTYIRAYLPPTYLPPTTYIMRESKVDISRTHFHNSLIGGQSYKQYILIIYDTGGALMAKMFYITTPES